MHTFNICIFVNIRSLPTGKPGCLVHVSNPSRLKTKEYKQEHFSHRKSYYCLIHFFGRWFHLHTVAWRTAPPHMYKTVSFAMNYEPQLVIYSRISSIQDVFLYIYLGVFDVKFLTPIVSSAGGARLFPYGSSVTRNLEALVYQTLDMLRNLTHHLHPRKSTMAPEKSPFAIGDNTSSNNSCFLHCPGVSVQVRHRKNMLSFWYFRTKHHEQLKRGWALVKPSVSIPNTMHVCRGLL